MRSCEHSKIKQIEKKQKKYIKKQIEMLEVKTH